ncbi:MAG: HD-GYP domain-containing protein [Pyrinomonadaceae bacterium]
MKIGEAKVGYSVTQEQKRMILNKLMKESASSRVLPVRVRDPQQILKTLVTALEERDVETYDHSQRVVEFSLRLARQLCLDQWKSKSLALGALLHDIGKIRVPDSILRKPGELTDEEWALMRNHPLYGQQMLGGIEFLEGASRVVGQHHEKWDGSGYPRGLAGEEIDLNARIFAVADAFDAMISDRVYRAGKTYESAVAELIRGGGHQFDPHVVDAFLRIPRCEWYELYQRSGTRNSAMTRDSSTRSMVSILNRLTSDAKCGFAA